MTKEEQKRMIERETRKGSILPELVENGIKQIMLVSKKSTSNINIFDFEILGDNDKKVMKRNVAPPAIPQFMHDLSNLNHRLAKYYGIGVFAEKEKEEWEEEWDNVK